jgi:imidazolonepropionase-like amidohydrolase/Tol biopolymer transport system component
MIRNRIFSPVLALTLLVLPAQLFAQDGEPEGEKGPSAETTLLMEGLPLEPGRTLTGTYTEASWMSVDLSPDGQMIVFDFLGDLYTMPFAGGAAEHLTAGMAFDAQPRFSPDGESVVFTSDRSGGENLWIISLDRADTTQLTKGKTSAYLSPEWTPDGDYVVATKGSKLWMYHKDGGSGIQLIDEPDNLRTFGAAFGTDDRFIWFSGRAAQGSLYNNGMRLFQLAVYDRLTGEVAGRSNRWGGALRPTLSPDGRYLAYVSRQVDQTGIRLRELGTDEERWLAYPVQRDDQESRASRDTYPGMTFTPDSRELVATYGGKLWRIPVEGGAAIEIPFEIQADLPIGPEVQFEYPVEDTQEFIAKQIRDAVPSPDGSKLAFSVLQELYVMDYPGGTPEKVVRDLDVVQQHPAWSPDGKSLAFAGWSDAEGGHLYKVDADGGRPEQLTRMPALYQYPKWAPDGERILAVRGAARVFEEALTRGGLGEPEDLIWIPAAGGEATLVVPMAGLRSPHFAGSADRIYAYHPREGLVSMRWDGTDRRAHIQVQGARGEGGRPQQTRTILISPNGDKVLAQVESDLWVMSIPLVGGDTPTIKVNSPAFPVKKLTDIGAQFPAWGPDGTTVHWSIGNAHIVYDLDAAEVYADSVEAAERAEREAADTASAADEPADDPAADEDAANDAAEEDEDDADEDKGYQPTETRIEVRIARDTPEGVIALRGARVITMRGNEVIENADIVIRNNRIEAVGPSGSVAIPDGATVRDVTGRTILPGYVDTHAHLRAAYEFHRPQPWSYAANLAYGVTTTRDPQTGTTDVITYEDMVRAGEMLGPRIYATGPGVFSSERIRDLDHARDVLKRYSEYYDTRTIKMYGAGNREQRQWIIQAARELELMPTTEGSLDLKVNLTMAQDGYSGTEHNLPAMPHYEDIVQLVAQSGMATTPTMLVTYGGPWAENYYYTTEDVLGDMKLRTFTPFEEVQQKVLRRTPGWFHENQYPFPLIADFVDRVVEAGGRGGIGSHGQLQGLGYHWELWTMGTGPDMTPHEALRIATIVGADALGLASDLGSIEPGKLADLVILNANPLDDLRNSRELEYVMMNGRLYASDSLDEVWPRQRQAGPFYWTEEGARSPHPDAGMERPGELSGMSPASDSPVTGRIEGAWVASAYQLKAGESHALRGRIVFTDGAWTVVFFVLDEDGVPRRASAEGGTYTVADDVVTFRHEYNFSQGAEIAGMEESPLRMEVNAVGSESEEPTRFSVQGSTLTLFFPSGNRMTFSRGG